MPIVTLDLPKGCDRHVVCKDGGFVVFRGGVPVDITDELADTCRSVNAREGRRLFVIEDQAPIAQTVTGTLFWQPRIMECR